MTRATVAVAGLPRAPEHPPTGWGYLAYIGRLIAFYSALWILTVVLATIALTAYALASAPQIAPDAPRVHGCAVILPEPEERDSAALRTRMVHPLDECDESAPVSFGASVRDGYTGRSR